MSKTVTANVPDELHAKLKREAELKGVTMSSLILARLEDDDRIAEILKLVKELRYLANVNWQTAEQKKAASKHFEALQQQSQSGNWTKPTKPVINRDRVYLDAPEI